MTPLGLVTPHPEWEADDFVVLLGLVNGQVILRAGPDGTTVAAGVILAAQRCHAQKTRLLIVVVLRIHVRCATGGQPAVVHDIDA